MCPRRIVAGPLRQLSPKWNRGPGDGAPVKVRLAVCRLPLHFPALLAASTRRSTGRHRIGRGRSRRHGEVARLEGGRVPRNSTGSLYFRPLLTEAPSPFRPLGGRAGRLPGGIADVAPGDIAAGGGGDTVRPWRGSAADWTLAKRDRGPREPAGSGRERPHRDPYAAPRPARQARARQQSLRRSRDASWL